jgi:hypothetical protein
MKITKQIKNKISYIVAVSSIIGGGVPGEYSEANNFIDTLKTIQFRKQHTFLCLLSNM